MESHRPFKTEIPAFARTTRWWGKCGTTDIGSRNDPRRCRPQPLNHPQTPHPHNVIPTKVGTSVFPRRCVQLPPPSLPLKGEEPIGAR